MSAVGRLLLDINEVARTLSVGRTTVYLLARRGDIELVKIGRRSLVTAASLGRYVETIASKEAAE